MFTSFTCQQVCSLRLSPTEWKLYFLKYLGLKPIKIFLLAFKKSVFSKGSVGHRYKNELVQLFRITRRGRKPLTSVRAEPCTKRLLAKSTDGSWCDATLQSSIMYFIKCICLNIFWDNWLYFTQKERILFAFMPHWTGSSSTQRPNVSQYVTICMSSMHY